MKYVRITARPKDAAASVLEIYAVLGDDNCVSEGWPAFGTWGHLNAEYCPFAFSNGLIDFGSDWAAERFYELDLEREPVKPGRVLTYALKGSNESKAYEITKITEIVSAASALHPFIQGLVQSLPEQNAEWPAAERVKWFNVATKIFDLIYKGENTIEARDAARTEEKT